MEATSTAVVWGLSMLGATMSVAVVFILMFFTGVYIVAWGIVQFLKPVAKILKK